MSVEEANVYANYIYINIINNLFVNLYCLELKIVHTHIWGRRKQYDFYTKVGILVYQRLSNNLLL